MKKLLLSVFMLCIAVSAHAGDETCSPCHGEHSARAAKSAHASIGCGACHEGAAEHAKGGGALPSVRFDLELCGGCHEDQFKTYTHGDDAATRFGGSPEKLPKTKDFSAYNEIVDGHGFTKEYNEERSHNFMLKDHFDIRRGKFETCLQCKSTKLAYYWNSGKERTIQGDHTVKAAHMKEAVVVPKGTKVKMETDFAAAYPQAYGVKVVVTMPDGKKYASYDLPGAEKDMNRTWAAAYALAVDGLPEGSPTRDSGNGCNQCHDPHAVGESGGRAVGFRVIRKAELEAIKKNGINPYKKDSAKSFDGEKPLTPDTSTALCAQCHVEYVCGVSGVDKIDRDFFPWAKAADLEKVNRDNFPGYGAYSTVKHVQDWRHGAGPLGSANAPGNGISYPDPHPIGEVLTKSQHPEAEAYWDSPHYGYGADCHQCHMPKVQKKDGKRFTSHWMASPYKYASAESMKPLAEKAGLKLEAGGTVNACAPCHKGADAAERLERAKKQQEEVYAQAVKVQGALMGSLAAIKDAKDAKAAGKAVDGAMLAAAVEDHREAHVRWENLAVSENSMGFHNPPEAARELDAALKYAESAKKKAGEAVKK